MISYLYFLKNILRPDKAKNSEEKYFDNWYVFVISDQNFNDELRRLLTKKKDKTRTKALDIISEMNALQNRITSGMEGAIQTGNWHLKTGLQLFFSLGNSLSLWLMNRFCICSYNRDGNSASPIGFWGSGPSAFPWVKTFSNLSRVLISFTTVSEIIFFSLVNPFKAFQNEERRNYRNFEPIELYFGSGHDD